MDRKELKKHAERFNLELEERNKAYFAMADNLTRNGFPDEASRVRALCLSREPEKPNTFLRALIPELDDAKAMMLQLSTDVISLLRDSGCVAQGGGVPVMGFVQACLAASSFFERMAIEHLLADDGSPTTPAMIDEWRKEAAELSARVEKLMDAASPG